MATKCAPIFLLAPFFFFVVSICAADKLVPSHRLGDLSVNVYAPAWTWQKQDINILLVLRNPADKETEVSVSLALPPGKEDHFEYAGGQDVVVSVPAGGEVRHAFTNIRAKDGVPRQEYVFTLWVKAGEESLAIPYPVRTIRGAAVSPGKWAAFVPALLAGAWCLVFAVVMARYAPDRAWMTPGPPIAEPEQPEPWITSQP